MKKFLICAIVLGILSVGASSGYFIWDKVQTKKSVEKEKKERRARLDKYYIGEIREFYDIRRLGNMPYEVKDYYLKGFENTKANMLSDGYDRAEISALCSVAYERSNQWLDSFPRLD